MKKAERILLYSDKQKAAQLDRNVEAVTTGANDLIRIYESFQTFERITTLQDAEELIRDPKGKMDAILIKQINPDMVKGTRKLNPKSIADLIGIEYDNYLRVLSGETVDPSTCKPCGAAAKVIRGKGVISFREYQTYQNYLTFSEDRFIISEDAVCKAKEAFNYYLETEAQIKEYNFWHNACDTLNELHKRGCLGGNPDGLAKTLNGIITFSYQVGKLSVDPEALFLTIQRLKSN